MAEETVEQLVDRYQKMVTAGRLLAPMASENLNYWLSGRGGTKVIASSHFSSNSAVVDHLRNVHRNVFLSIKDPNKGIRARLKRTPISPTYELTWEDSTYALPFTDLYFGLGGFTLKSVVTVAVSKDTVSSWNVAFTKWTAQVFDNYNWDVGKSVNIPGWGNIRDTDAVRVERAGRAKSYLIQSEPWQVTNLAITKPAKVSI